MHREVCIFRPDPKPFEMDRSLSFDLLRLEQALISVLYKVTYLTGFRTAGPFVFWIAANGGKKFNFPCKVPEAASMRGTETPVPVVGVGL